MVNAKKVVLVGDGAVGSTFAFSLLQQRVAFDELVIVDLKQERALGDVADLEDVTPLGQATTVRVGSYADAKDAAIVVITAGVPRKSGESRLDLVQKNATILKSIVEPVVASGFNGIFLVSSNPVDILTTLTWKLSGFPKNRVIGTGTSLDTARLQVLLARETGNAAPTVDAMVLGEHGDTSFVNFAEATVANQPLADLVDLTPEFMNQVESTVQHKGGEIIKRKGATFYGVARFLAEICAAILENRNQVLPVSAPVNGLYGLTSDLFLGTPAVLNQSGVAQVIETPLAPAELAKMQNSAAKMKAVLDSVDA